MTNKFHGVFSVILAGISFLIGIFAVAKVSMLIGLVYLLLIVSLFLLIVYSYCCKCTCREYACGHVIFGKIAQLLPKRKQGKYSVADIMGVALALLILIAFPQYWLLKSILLFIAFWALIITAGIEIVLFVCTSCKNEKCALCKNKVNSKLS